MLFHYGSYEAKFMERMKARHGGDAATVARLRGRSVNTLSLTHSRVYFPAYSNRGLPTSTPSPRDAAGDRLGWAG